MRYIILCCYSLRYHFFQKVLPSLGSSYDIMTSEKSRKEVYIVFQEASSIKDLNPFTRFVLAFVLTGGRVQRINYAYAEGAVYASETNSRVLFLEKLHVEFTSDLLLQSAHELFVKSFATESVGLDSVCANNILDVPLKSLKTKNWLPQAVNLTHFQNFVHRTCNISTDWIDMSPTLVTSDLKDDSAMLADSISNPDFDLNTYIAPISRMIKKVVVYQRNRNRRILDVDSFIADLNSTIGRENWSVELVVHDESRSPCELVKKMYEATVLVSAHGFVNVLLLFQPLNSVLVEIHTNMLYLPDFYGSIQHHLKNSLRIARSSH